MAKCPSSASRWPDKAGVGLGFGVGSKPKALKYWIMKVKVGFPVYKCIVNTWFTNYWRVLATRPTSNIKVLQGDEATRITYELPVASLSTWTKKSRPPTPSQPRKPLPAVFCHPSSSRVSASLASWCSIEPGRKTFKILTETQPPPPTCVFLSICVTGSLEKLANPWRGHRCEWSSKETSKIAAWQRISWKCEYKPNISQILANQHQETM